MRVIDAKSLARRTPVIVTSGTWEGLKAKIWITQKREGRWRTAIIYTTRQLRDCYVLHGANHLANFPLSRNSGYCITWVLPSEIELEKE